MGSRIALEVIAVTVEDALAAEAGGADRLELIANFPEGGVTPSYGVIAAIRQAVRLPVYVMVRPRGGDFCYSEAELKAMAEDGRIAAELGADGVVVGALTREGAVHEEAVRRVLESARLPATFHRAIDEAADIQGALLQVASLPYVERVLTSGGAPSAAEGAGAIGRLVQASRERGGRPAPLEIMLGVGVSVANAAGLIGQTGVTAVHVGTGARHGGSGLNAVSEERVREFRRILDGR